jgi:hypothetical protein
LSIADAGLNANGEPNAGGDLMLEAGPGGNEVVLKSSDASAGVAETSELGRHEERYPVAGEAEVIVNGGASLFRGRILNISNSGCYVQTLAQRRLPRGTSVELILAFKRRVIQVSAEARFSKPGVGIGFLFVNVTDDTQDLLHDQIEAMQTGIEEKAVVSTRTAWKDSIKR